MQYPRGRRVADPQAPSPREPSSSPGIAAADSRPRAANGFDNTDVELCHRGGLEDAETRQVRQHAALLAVPPRQRERPTTGREGEDAGLGPSPRVRSSRPELVGPTEPAPVVLAPGGRIGKYELRERLGMGTFGLVFHAYDTELERDVALKVLNPTHITNLDVLQRFLQEARASARIHHPGIVTVFDCGRVPMSTGDTAFITMELLQGENLTVRLARCGRLPPEIACELARQVASALGAAHRADVLHRDLKPDNIYLVPDPAVPAGERVKVIDFGLAKLGRHGHTISNTIFGTPRYMSPEQCRSSGEIDQRSDVYALGCVLFELVTGQTPFDGDLRQLVQRHQHAKPPRARAFAPELPQELDDLIDHMLAKDPAARPQTMGAVQRALRAVGALLTDGPATLIPNPARRLALGPTEPLPALRAPGTGPQDFDTSDAGPEDADTDTDAEIIVPAPRPVPRRNPALMLPLPPEGRRRRRRHAFVTAAVALVIAGLLVTLITREVTRASPDEVPAAVPARRAP